MHPRLSKNRIEEALEDTRIILIAGPRQSGKTTLVTEIANNGRSFLTLDDATQLRFAKSDPVGFLREVDRAVISEVQRAPELFMAINAEVDKDKRPGRYLLTGSANLMTVPRVSESLAGRVEVIQLLPLSQAEIRRRKGRFLEDAFSGRTPITGEPILGKDLIELVLAGGYPEVLKCTQWQQRQDWHLNYVNSIIQRDVHDIASVEQHAVLPKLLSVLAEFAGQLVNCSAVGSALGMYHVTTRKYMRIFESLYLINSLQPWFTNKLKRLNKSPKLHFLDSGLLSMLKGVSPAQIEKDRTKFGAILESFVFGEIQKLAGWSNQPCFFSHFRNKDGNKVDFVIENLHGEVLGIEVKASATVTSKDFSGLRKLASACGENFVQGIVLYDHDQAVPFGKNLCAAPLASLWA